MKKNTTKEKPAKPKIQTETVSENNDLTSKLFAYLQGKSELKKPKKKKAYKHKVKQSLFFMIVLNGCYLLTLVCMRLQASDIITTGVYVKLMFLYSVCMSFLGLFYLPHRPSHYGMNLNDLRFNLLWGTLLGILFAGFAVILRFYFVSKGRMEFAFNPIPEWEFFLYPFSVLAQEMIIRGYLQTYFISLFDYTIANKWIAILFSSIIFALLHLMYGFQVTIYCFLFSFVLSIFFDKTRSLVGVTIIHFLVGTAMFYFKY